jgi:transposase-like protein
MLNPFSSVSTTNNLRMEFFRHCPECGRRFHIKLESTKLVSEHRERLPGKKRVATVVVRSQYGGTSMTPLPLTPTAVSEGKPIIVDVEEFQYAYKCTHCGHEWSEKRMASRKE